MARNILIVDPSKLPDSAKANLAKIGNLVLSDDTRESLLKQVVDAHIVFTLLSQNIDREVISRGTNLQVIATPTTGLNHIDLKYAQERGITVVSLRGEVDFLNNITATAELTWTLLLALSRRLIEANSSVEQGLWDRNNFIGNELKGKTIGIVGYGRLGRIVAQYAHAFRMKVLAADIESKQVESYVEMLELDELLRQSDVVTVHVPFNENTRGFFNKAKFDLMKRSSVLINTSRGEVIEESSLLDALVTKSLAGAGLDVLNNETSLDPHWLRQNPLRAYMASHSNLIVTPHIGGATFESMEQTSNFLSEKLANQFR